MAILSLLQASAITNNTSVNISCHILVLLLEFLQSIYPWAELLTQEVCKYPASFTFARWVSSQSTPILPPVSWVEEFLCFSTSSAALQCCPSASPREVRALDLGPPRGRTAEGTLPATPPAPGSWGKRPSLPRGKQRPPSAFPQPCPWLTPLSNTVWAGWSAWIESRQLPGLCLPLGSDLSERLGQEIGRWQ